MTAPDPALEPVNTMEGPEAASLRLIAEMHVKVYELEAKLDPLSALVGKVESLDALMTQAREMNAKIDLVLDIARRGEGLADQLGGLVQGLGSASGAQGAMLRALVPGLANLVR